MSLLPGDKALAGLSASVAIDASQLESAPRQILSVHLIAVAMGVLLNGLVLGKLQSYAVGVGREDRVGFRLLVGLVMLFQLLHVGFSLAGLHMSCVSQALRRSSQCSFVGRFGVSDAFTILPWPLAMRTALTYRCR